MTWCGPMGRVGCSRRRTWRTRGQHLILSRLDETGRDPRFRLTPLGGSRYALSVHEHNRWQPLPYEGRLHEMVAVMNTDLVAWASEWPSPLGTNLRHSPLSEDSTTTVTDQDFAVLDRLMPHPVCARNRGCMCSIQARKPSKQSMRCWPKPTPSSPPATPAIGRFATEQPTAACERQPLEQTLGTADFWRLLRRQVDRGARPRQTVLAANVRE